MEKSKNRKTIHSNRSSVQSNNAGNKTPATVWINIRGTNRRGDLDGKIATVLDCLVDEGIITDDRVSEVDRTLSTFEKRKIPGIDIVIMEEIRNSIGEDL